MKIIITIIIIIIEEPRGEGRGRTG